MCPKIQPIKAKIIAKTYLDNGMDMTKTARELAGNKDLAQGTIYQKSNQWLKSPEVNEALINLLKDAGIEKQDITEMIAGLIKELANSKETTAYKGEVIESNVSNYKARGRLLEVLLKSLLETNKSTTHQHLHLEGKSDEEIKKLITDQLKEMEELGVIKKGEYVSRGD